MLGAVRILRLEHSDDAVLSLLPQFFTQVGKLGSEESPWIDVFGLSANAVVNRLTAFFGEAMNGVPSGAGAVKARRA